jgi:hypothetical protein
MACSWLACTLLPCVLLLFPCIHSIHLLTAFTLTLTLCTIRGPAVYRGQWRDRVVAVKIIDCTLGGGKQNGTSAAEVALHEAELSRNLDHPCIVKVRRYYDWVPAKPLPGSKAVLAGVMGVHTPWVDAMALCRAVCTCCLAGWGLVGEVDLN